MTKKERIAATITGIALFCVAALFSIGLFLGLLDFGSTGSRFLTSLGQMLLSVYGICSILIPSFFFLAGSFCLSARWNIQRAFILLVSIIPFFTLVAAERSSSAIAEMDSSPLAYVKIFSIIFIAILLVILEYLLAVTVASFIEKKLKEKIEGEDSTPRKKENAVEEIEWGPQYTDMPKADPKEYEDNGELEEKEAAQKNHSSAGKNISFLKGRPSELKKIFFPKIYSASKKNHAEEKNPAEDEISKDALNPAVKADTKKNEIDGTNENAITAPAVQAKEKFSFNWSIDDEGNVKNHGEKNEDEIPEIMTENNTAEEKTEEAEKQPFNPSQENSTEYFEEKDFQDELQAEKNPEKENDFPEQENDEIQPDETIEIPSDEELENHASETFAGSYDFETSVDETETFAGENPESNGMDIIDHFEHESECLTENVKNEISEPDEKKEIEYDMDFEDYEEAEPEESMGENFYPEEIPEDVVENISAEDIEYEEFKENFITEESETLEEDEKAEDDDGISDEANLEISSVKSSDTGMNDSDRTANFNPESASLGDIFLQMEMDAKENLESSGNGSPSAANSEVNPPAVLSSSGKIENETAIPPKKKKTGTYRIPTDLLHAYAENEYWLIDEETRQASVNLQETLKEFSIIAEITGIRKGPVVTMFEILPAPGVKLSKIVGLADNIALRLAAQSVRIVAPIPGKRAVGIEIPNKNRAIVSFRECIEQNRPEWKKMSVPVILGKDIEGETQIMDLVKTPHLLIAGSTGAGKSVCVNSMILSILYKRSPSDVKMILIDPKVVELKLYNHIPHLLTPVITEPKKAMQALQYCLCEMERRYAVLDSLGCRDISSYNKKIVDQHIATEKIPYLIVIIDEFADLMATTGKQLEGVVARLCAMSRAVGIHLVLATQRPSVDVITGLIKANIPSRVAFMVAAKTDSRIIIDQVGAEKLLGKGDMLYASATDPFPIRIQGAFVSDQEVENVVEAVKEWGEPEYIDDEIFVDDEEEDSGAQISLFNDGADDPLYDKALDIVVQAGKASASYIQRRLSIGYNRAARLVELMEERGIVGPANGSKPREIIHIP